MNIPDEISLYSTMKPIDVIQGASISSLLKRMSQTSAQGKTLGQALHVLECMLDDPRVTIFMGLAGSLAVAGQSRLVAWLIENGLIDVLVSTGANISEDLIDALGYQIHQCQPGIDDRTLRDAGYNRFYDVYLAEKDYVSMTELIADFFATLSPDVRHSSRTLLQKFGQWLLDRGVNCILSSAARLDVPVFSPALLDSAFGDAVLISKSRGQDLLIDAVQDYVEFMSLKVDETGVIYIGGGVPKDFIQTFAVSADFLFGTAIASQRRVTIQRNSLNRTFCPHKYTLQITADSPQWGGSSGASLSEGVSWGKQKSDGFSVECYCDATIALPLLAHAIAERRPAGRVNQWLRK